MTPLLQNLPVELITSIMEELDLPSLIIVANLSAQLRSIASDSYLNPWRKPIIRALLEDPSENNGQLSALLHLSERRIAPRQNWIEILTLAPPSLILLNATIPNLHQEEWEICYRRRFLPSWTKWKRDYSWREAYKRTLARVWHRSQASCTADEAWTKYITLNKNGSANELESSSRTFNPLAIFNNMKIQSNLAHLETQIRLVVAFADVRVLAFGVLNRPRGTFTVNKNARLLLHPPGVERGASSGGDGSMERDSSTSPVDSFLCTYKLSPPSLLVSAHKLEQLTRPLPAMSHFNYPFHTPGGGDKRWIGDGLSEEDGRLWVGTMMLTAQITGPHTRTHFTDSPPFQDLDLTSGPGRGQYASFTWSDLDAIAPWMNDLITKRIDGPGLGN